MKCKRTVHNTFSTFNDGQTDCYISFDEIHVKPGLQFQNIVCSDRDTATSLPASEFTINLSRGSLSLPPINLLDFSLYYYAFFKSRETKCCTKIFLEAFEYIHDYTGYAFPNIGRINRRFCNCFLKHL